MGLLYYLSYVGVVAAFAFVTLSLASGLLYVSELIEEHSQLAKSIGQRTIYAILGLHVILYFTDKLPLPHTIFSIACHIVYLQNFSSTWPIIDLMSIPFIASCILVIADHFIWFFYFARITNEARRLRTYRVVVQEPPGFTEIASFFGLCVWLAPLFLFLSLSANDNALPLSALEPPTTPSLSAFSTTQQTQALPRVSLIRSMFAFLSFDSIPRIRRPMRKDTSEGIIAPRPRSPAPPRTSLGAAPPASPRPTYLSPPKSPLMRAQEIDARPSTNPTFRLHTPPRRSMDGPSIRRVPTGDALGLGFRRTASYTADDQ